ncbi:MAG: hypothetical protein Q4C68_07470 [Moraxella sp.]|nr:hypothetical protein [Moraxella sp.]
MLISKNITARTLLMLILPSSAMLMTACQQEPQAPKAGDYGQVLLKNTQLRQSQINDLNTVIPKTYDEASRLVNYPKAEIRFVAEANKNPYRFVMVVRGKALNQGATKLSFTTETYKTEGAGNIALGLIKQEYDKPYAPNSNVIAVLASEPFSIGNENANKEFGVTAYIKQRENIAIEHIELQLWQGKGEKRSSVSYAWFFLIIVAVVGIALRFVRGVFQAK